MGRHRKIFLLPGEKYGRLTVIREGKLDKRHNRTYLCKCDCGVYKEFELKNLRNGNSQSCGCMKGRAPRIYIAKGTRFGRLVVLGEAPGVYSGSWAKRQFYCHCDCGADKIIAMRSLRSGLTQSCGCLRVEKMSGKRPFRSLKRLSFKRLRDPTLTDGWFRRGQSDATIKTVVEEDAEERWVSKEFDDE
jgi:hypothetical protein